MKQHEATRFFLCWVFGFLNLGALDYPIKMYVKLLILKQLLKWQPSYSFGKVELGGIDFRREV